MLNTTRQPVFADARCGRQQPIGPCNHGCVIPSMLLESRGRKRRADTRHLTTEPSPKVHVLGEQLQAEAVRANQLNYSKRKRDEDICVDCVESQAQPVGQTRKRPCLDSQTPINPCLNIHDTDFCNRITHKRKRMDSYNTFQYWRPILPDIDLELELLEQSPPASGASIKKTRIGEPPQDVMFNSFNYWRTPIPEIDLDLESL